MSEPPFLKASVIIRCLFEKKRGKKKNRMVMELPALVRRDLSSAWRCRRTGGMTQKKRRMSLRGRIMVLNCYEEKRAYKERTAAKRN
jgi:hypothetical protein